MSAILKNLFLNPTYIFSVLAITNIMFILTALQYWSTPYGINVLKGQKALVELSFSATVITSPCLGAIIGGVITTKYLGSYTNKKALSLCFFMYCLFVIWCIPTPLVNDYILFIALMWLAIFSQGFIEPIILGIYLNTVTPIERPAASSLGIFIQMGIGMLPAPYLYGKVQDSYAVYDEHGNNVSRAGMYMVFFSSVIGGFFLLIAILLRARSQKNGQARMRETIRMTTKGISQEEVDEIFLNMQQAEESDPQVQKKIRQSTLLYSVK